MTEVESYSNIDLQNLQSKMWPARKRKSLTVATLQAQHAAIRDRNVFSPCMESGEQSPMTVLSNTLGAITVDTPKRTLFDGLDGGDTPTSASVSASRSSSECSSESGCCMDSPSPVDSTFSVIDEFKDATSRERKNSLTSLKMPVYSLQSHRDSIAEKEEGHNLLRLHAIYDATLGKENSLSEDAETMTTDEETSRSPIYMKSPRHKTVSPATSLLTSCQSLSSVPPSIVNQGRSTSAPATMFESRKRAQTTVDDSPVNLRYSRLTSSEDNDDDGFIDILDSDSNDACNAEVSATFAGLMEGAILREPSPKKMTMQNLFTSPTSGALKDIDCNTLNTTPGGPKARRGIFKVPSQPVLRRSSTTSSFLKRPDRPRDCPSPIMNKRARSCSIAVSSPSTQGLLIRPEPIKPFSSGKPLLARSLSASVMETKSSPMSMGGGIGEIASPDLIGDHSKPYCLPLCTGKHRNLKSITPETVCRLINSEFSDEVEEYHIIDCRYPYEYEGGHIKGGLNLYTKESIQEFFLKQPMKPLDKRRIIVFHCEFSSKRGPTMLNFLRNTDRARHSTAYPLLDYPELYLLEGGYKAFFEHDKTYCVPQTYKPMDHAEHLQDLRHFKAKSKSWAGERSRLNLHSRKLLPSSQPSSSSQN